MTIPVRKNNARNMEQTSKKEEMCSNVSDQLPKGSYGSEQVLVNEEMQRGNRIQETKEKMRQDFQNEWLDENDTMDQVIDPEH